MKIVYALSGGLIAELDDPKSDVYDAKVAASEALNLHPALLRVHVTECSVVVLSGKVICDHCSGRVACTCGTQDARVCECKTLDREQPKGVRELLCETCEERERREEEFELWLEYQKDAAMR